jgi:ubiquinone/menaquinone biosynthesis C-methylase UbiE
MNPAEFDKFAEEYRTLHAANIAASGELPEYFAEYKVRDIFRLHLSLGTEIKSPRILDFGAGIGTSVLYFRKYFPKSQMTCLDVSNKSLEIGKTRFGREAKFVIFDGKTIPFSDCSFDIAFAACVFHHIDYKEHVAILHEFHRVLVPGGIAMVYEHNPYNPLTVRAVNTCVFDENAQLIVGSAMKKSFKYARFRQARIRYRVFFPKVLQWLRPLEKSITWLPLGAQYYVFAQK